MDFGEVPTGLPFSILPFENHRVCPVLYHHSCRSLGGRSRSSIPEPGAVRIGPFVLAKLCYYSTEQVHDSKVNPCTVVGGGSWKRRPIRIPSIVVGIRISLDKVKATGLLRPFLEAGSWGASPGLFPEVRQPGDARSWVDELIQRVEGKP